MGIRMTYPMLRRREVEIDGCIVRLEPQAFKLAERLLLCGSWTTNEEAIELLWPNPNTQPLTARTALSVYLYRLRSIGFLIDVDYRGGIKFNRGEPKALFAPNGSHKYPVRQGGSEMNIATSAAPAERDKRCVSFSEHARIAQNIKAAMADSPNWSSLAPDMKETLEMIAHKAGRILNGDPKVRDSWHDIISYTQFVADRLVA